MQPLVPAPPTPRGSQSPTTEEPTSLPGRLRWSPAYRVGGPARTYSTSFLSHRHAGRRQIFAVPHSSPVRATGQNAEPASALRAHPLHTDTGCDLSWHPTLPVLASLAAGAAGDSAHIALACVPSAAHSEPLQLAPLGDAVKTPGLAASGSDIRGMRFWGGFLFVRQFQPCA